MKISMKKNGGHIIDIVFTLALFCVFAASALIVVLIGANVYKSASAAMGENFNTRTSVMYIATKIRQNDAAGAVRVGSLDGNAALVLEQTIGEQAYETWIYAYNGELREIFSAKGISPKASDGLVIMEVQSLQIEELANSMLLVTSTDQNGKVTSITLYPRCV